MAVYFIRDPTGPIKIGSAKRPLARMRDLQIGNPRKLTLLIYVDGGEPEEMALHRRFSKDRLEGEWFSPSPALLAFIEKVRAGEALPKKKSGRERRAEQAARVARDLAALEARLGSAPTSPVPELAPAPRFPWVRLVEPVASAVAGEAPTPPAAPAHAAVVSPPS